MRVVLRSLRMVNFRRFLDKTIDFGPGFNLVVGPNESGKTSIHQAILLAIYGLNPTRETLSREKARSWLNDAECSLELCFEADGVEYRIVRGITSSPSRVRLEKRLAGSGDFVMEADNASGVTRWLAEKIGVPEVQLFNRSVSICQADLAKVGNLREGEQATIESILYGGEYVTPEAALSYLQRLKGSIEKQRGARKGELPEAEEELEKVKAALAEAEGREERVRSVREEIGKLETALPELEKRLVELERFLERVGKRAALVEKIQKAEERLRELEEAHRCVRDTSNTIERCRQELARMGPAGCLGFEGVEALMNEVAQLEKRQREVSEKMKVAREKARNASEMLESAAPRAERFKELRAELQRFGALAEADLGRVRSEIDEARQQPEKVAGRVAHIEERLERMRAALAEAQSALDERPELGDPEALQAEWLRMETLLEEKGRALSAAHEDFRRARRDQPGGKFRLIAAVIGMIIITSGAVLAGTVHVGWGALAVLGVAVFIIGLYGHSHARVMWKRNVDAAERRYGQLKDEKAEVERNRAQVLEQLGTTAEELPGLLREFRERLAMVRQLNSDIEVLERERDDLLARARQEQVDPDSIAQKWGYAGVQELSEALDRLEEVRREVETTERELRAALRLDEASDPLVCVEELRSACDRWEAEKEACERERAELEKQERMLLEKVGVKSLDEAHSRLREILRVHEAMLSARKTLDSMLLGKVSSEALEEEVRKLRIAYSADCERLREEFEGFEPEAMQVSQCRSEREQLAARLKEQNDRLNNLRGRLKELEQHLEGGESVADLLGRREYLEGEIQRYTETLEAARKAEEILRAVMEQPPGMAGLQAAASAHLKAITRGVYREIRIRTTLRDTVVVENDGGREVKYEDLSQGTVDQMYFALRLALADVLGRECRLPLLMDDPFVNFDRDRLRNAMEILARLVESGHQVVYFTVHDTLAGLLDEWQTRGLQVRKSKLG